MVDAEFDRHLAQVEADRKREATGRPRTRASPRTSCKAEYRKIAERRVRLGLVLAEIGRAQPSSVTEPDSPRPCARRPCATAQAQQVFDLLRQNANAQAQLRAPVYEDKVVDLLFGLAQVTDRRCRKDELLADDELPEGYGEAPAKPALQATPAKAAEKPTAPAKASRPRAQAGAASGARGRTRGREAPKKPAAKAKAAAPCGVLRR